MRLGLCIGSVVLTGFALTVTAACGSSESTVTEDPGGKTDSGTDPGVEEQPGNDGGKDPDADTPSTLKPTELKAGAAAIMGIAGDDVIVRTAAAVEAIPIAGGAPTKIADLGAGTGAIVRGGAVAVYTAIANGRGTLNVWTRANGYKTNVATNSATGFFAATPDGARIAFSVGTLPAGANPPTSTAIAISSTATPSNTPITGMTAAQRVINLAAEDCSADIGFVGTRFFGAYCNGTATATTNALLMTVPGDATAATLLHTATPAASAIQPFWLGDTAGAKLVVFGHSTGTPADELRVVTVAGAGVLDIEGTVPDGTISSDGTQVYYRTAGGKIRRAATAAPINATDVVAAGVKGFITFSEDKSRALYFTTDPDPETNTVDLKLVDVKAGGTPVDIAASGVLPIGFNAGGTHVLFLGDLGAKGAKLKAVPVAGGQATDLASDTVGALLAPEGNGAIYLTEPKDLGNDLTAFALSYVDSVAGGKGEKFVEAVPDGQIRFKGKDVIYTSVGDQDGKGAGIFKLTLK